MKFQMTLMRLQQKPAPDLEELAQKDYEHMLTLSNNQRQKYYTYLFKTQCANKATLVIPDFLVFSFWLAKYYNKPIQFFLRR